jgi:hypothetical protein
MKVYNVLDGNKVVDPNTLDNQEKNNMERKHKYVCKECGFSSNPVTMGQHYKDNPTHAPANWVRLHSGGKKKKKSEKMKCKNCSYVASSFQDLGIHYRDYPGHRPAHYVPKNEKKAKKVKTLSQWEKQFSKPLRQAEPSNFGVDITSFVDNPSSIHKALQLLEDRINQENKSITEREAEISAIKERLERFQKLQIALNEFRNVTEQVVSTAA